MRHALASHSTAPIAPGTYLRKRREAARLGLRQAAASIAALPWAIRPAGPVEVGRMAARLKAAEESGQHFTPDQLRLIRNVVPLDPHVYETLIAIEKAGPGSGIIPPQLCRVCACSWCSPCATSHGPCAWAEPDLCTGCAQVAAVEAELGGASRMFELHQQVPA